MCAGVGFYLCVWLQLIQHFLSISHLSCNCIHPNILFGLHDQTCTCPNTISSVGSAWIRYIPDQKFTFKIKALPSSRHLCILSCLILNPWLGFFVSHFCCFTSCLFIITSPLGSYPHFLPLCAFCPFWVSTPPGCVSPVPNYPASLVYLVSVLPVLCGSLSSTFVSSIPSVSVSTSLFAQPCLDGWL